MTRYDAVAGNVDLVAGHYSVLSIIRAVVLYVLKLHVCFFFVSK